MLFDYYLSVRVIIYRGQASCERRRGGGGKRRRGGGEEGEIK